MSRAYKDTVLKGYSNYPAWKLDVDADLNDRKLKKFVTGAMIVPQEPTLGKFVDATGTTSGTTETAPTPAEVKAFDDAEAKYDEWSSNNSQCIKVLRQSVSETLKIDIQGFQTPKEMYHYLVKRYPSGNAARIRTLVDTINSVVNMKNSTVAEKCQLMQSNNDEIRRAKPADAVSESTMISHLIKSMSDEYSSVIDVIDSMDNLTLEDVRSRLEVKETKLNDPPLREEVVMVTSRERERYVKYADRLCNHCKEKGHIKMRCPQWRATTEGKGWMTSKAGKNQLKKDKEWEERNTKKEVIANVMEDSTSEDSTSEDEEDRILRKELCSHESFEMAPSHRRIHAAIQINCMASGHN